MPRVSATASLVQCHHQASS